MLCDYGQGQGEVPMLDFTYWRGSACPSVAGIFRPFGRPESRTKGFWFYADDISRCVHGTVRESILLKPEPPVVWPTKLELKRAQI